MLKNNVWVAACILNNNKNTFLKLKQIDGGTNTITIQNPNPNYIQFGGKISIWKNCVTVDCPKSNKVCIFYLSKQRNNYTVVNTQVIQGNQSSLGNEGLIIANNSEITLYSIKNGYIQYIKSISDLLPQQITPQTIEIVQPYLPCPYILITDKNSNAYIVNKNSYGKWQYKQNLNIVMDEKNQKFGKTVCVSGYYLTVNDPMYDKGNGKVYLFQLGTTQFNLIATFTGQNNENLGSSTGITILNGKIITVASAPNYNDGDGMVYLFTIANK